MNNITIVGKYPEWVKIKAHNIIKTTNKLRSSSKKLTGLKNYYSIKVSSNYRMLFSDSNNFFLCSHNHYDKKIKNIKRQGA